MMAVTRQRPAPLFVRRMEGLRIPDKSDQPFNRLPSCLRANQARDIALRLQVPHMRGLRRVGLMEALVETRAEHSLR